MHFIKDVAIFAASVAHVYAQITDPNLVVTTTSIPLPTTTTSIPLPTTTTIPVSTASDASLLITPVGDLLDQEDYGCIAPAQDTTPWTYYSDLAQSAHENRMAAINDLNDNEKCLCERQYELTKLLTDQFTTPTTTSPADWRILQEWRDWLNEANQLDARQKVYERALEQYDRDVITYNETLQQITDMEKERDDWKVVENEINTKYSGDAINVPQDPEYTKALENLSQAQKDAVEAQQEVKDAQERVDAAQGPVDEAQKLVDQADARVEQAQAAVDQAQAAVDLAQSTLDAASSNARRRAAQRALDTTQATLDAAQATLDSEQATQETELATLETEKAKLAQEQNALDAANAKVTAASNLQAGANNFIEFYEPQPGSIYYERALRFQKKEYYEREMQNLTNQIIRIGQNDALKEYRDIFLTVACNIQVYTSDKNLKAAEVTNKVEQELAEFRRIVRQERDMLKLSRALRKLPEQLKRMQDWTLTVDPSAISGAEQSLYNQAQCIQNVNTFNLYEVVTEEINLEAKSNIEECRARIWGENAQALADLDLEILQINREYKRKYEDFHDYRHAYLRAKGAYEEYWWELKGFWNPVQFEEEIKGRLRRASERAVAGISNRDVYDEELKDVSYYTQLLNLVKESESSREKANRIRNRIDYLNRQVRAAKVDLDREMEAYEDAYDEMIRARTASLAVLEKEDSLASFKSTAVARLSAELEEAKRLNAIEQNFCEDSVSPITPDADTRIEELRFCTANVFLNERREHIRADLQRKSRRQRFDNEIAQSVGLHNTNDEWAPWDYSQADKCQKAQQLVDRLEEELEIAQQRAWRSDTIIFDCEQQISECVDFHGDLGIFEQTEWKRDYCPLDYWNAESEAAKAAAIFDVDPFRLGQDSYRSQAAALYPETCNVTMPFKHVTVGSWIGRTWDIPTAVEPTPPDVLDLYPRRDELRQQWDDTVFAWHHKAEEWFVCNDAQPAIITRRDLFLDLYDQHYAKVMSEYRWRREYWLASARYRFGLAQDLQNEFDTAFNNVYQSNEAFFYLMQPAESIVKRQLAGNSVKDATDMAMATCLDPYYRIDGIKVCTRNHTDDKGASVADPDTGLPVQRIVGVQAIYGNNGRQCDWTLNTVEEKGGYRNGVEHGSMTGTCNSRYFQGRYPESLYKFVDAQTGDLIGMTLEFNTRTSSDMGRHLGTAEETMTFGSPDWSGTTQESYVFSGTNNLFGFESTYTTFVSGELNTLDIVNYDPEALWNARIALDENPQKIQDTLLLARQYTTRAYEDDHWEYLYPQFEMSRVMATVQKATAGATLVTRPAERDALQARIDKALAAKAAIDPEELNNHNNDDDQDENEDLLIASIIGSVVLILMMFACCYKYVTRSRLGEMASVTVGPSGDDSVRSNSSLTPGVRNVNDM